MTTEPEWKKCEYMFCGTDEGKIRLTIRLLVQWLRFSPLSGRISVGETHKTKSGYSVTATIWTHDHCLVEKWLRGHCEHVEL